MKLWNNLIASYDLTFKVMNNAYLLEDIEKIGEQLSKCINSGGTIYIAGNGGSASDASHFAGEILGRFYKERKGLPCIALGTDLAITTAISNDYGYDAVFERQLEAMFNPEKDIFIGISTSGHSKNIIRAMDYIAQNGGNSIALLGKDGGFISAQNFPNEQYIIIPSQDTPRIQELHMFILHYWAEVIEEGWVNK